MMLQQIVTKSVSNIHLPAISSRKSSFRPDILQIIQDTNDSTVDDSKLIEQIECAINSDDQELSHKKIKETKDEIDEFTILHFAAKNCRPSLFKYLIDMFSFDKDIQSKGLLTPLHLFVRNNLETQDEEKNKKIDILYKVITETKSANINAQDEKGMTPLHYAVSKNNHKCAHLLLNTEGIKLNVQDKNLLTPLHLAVMNGNDQMAYLLIHHTDTEGLLAQATPDSLLIHMCCKNKVEKLELVKYILDKLRTSSTEENNLLDTVFNLKDNNQQTLLHIAIQNKHLGVVECLINDYNIDKEMCECKSGNFPIHTAARVGSIEMLDLFVKYDFDLYAKNNKLENALHIAAANNKDKFIERFLHHEYNQRQNKINCECCDDEANTTIPSVQELNTNFLTAFLTTAIRGNIKCLEVLSINPENKIDIRDKNGNSIYHIFAEHSHIDCFRYVAKHFYDKTHKLLTCSNNQEETVLCIAARRGDLDLIKIIYNLLDDTSFEEVFSIQNNDGQTCFHIACLFGYINIVEYFLKELKMIDILEQVDNNSNTPMHLASYGGHLNIVQLLLSYNTEFSLKNIDKLTSLDLSCRKGHFEISKHLLSQYSTIENEQTGAEHPLHIACSEGAHEVVKLLLDKGASIELLNSNNKNCLDIAINKGHRDVIKVLLDNPNWKKLIRSTNIENDLKVSKTKISKSKSLHLDDDPEIENPQLVGLFENKMWDMLEIILDKTLDQSDSENKVDFSILDMKVKNMSKHSLTLIARSGQENLVKHEATLLLLKLKWRFLPRFAYYFNIFIYVLFLLFVSIFSLNMVDHYKDRTQYVNATNYTSSYNDNYTNDSDSSIDDIYEKLIRDDSQRAYSLKDQHLILYYFLMFFVVINLMKEFLQFTLLNSFNYMLSVKNWLELATYIGVFISLTAEDLDTQATYGSVSILAAYFVLPLKMQKIRVIGLYVVAFTRTLKNTLKFFPIFLIMLLGFFLSFKIRANFGIELFKGNSELQFMKTITLVLGESNSDDMGLHSYTNYFIYFMFIGLMSVIILNLLVGIAVSDINQVLSEADIRQINMRIMFVLQIQKSTNIFRDRLPFARKCLNMSYSVYDLKKESNAVCQLKATKKKVHSWFKKDQDIILVDPQKRLEEILTQLCVSGEKSKGKYESQLSVQFERLDRRLQDSERGLEDKLIDLSRLLATGFDSFKDKMVAEQQSFEKRLNSIELCLNGGLARISNDSSYMNHKNKQSIDEKLVEIQAANEERAEKESLLLQRNLNKIHNDILGIKAKLSGI